MVTTVVKGQSTPNPPNSVAKINFHNSDKSDSNVDERRHTEGPKSKRKWICVQQFAFNIFLNTKIHQIPGRFPPVESTHNKSKLSFKYVWFDSLLSVLSNDVQQVSIWSNQIDEKCICLTSVRGPKSRTSAFF